MRRAPVDEVASYLQRAKVLIAARNVVVMDSQKNRALLAALGLRYQHQLEILLALTPQNYCETRDALAGADEEAWVFGVREGSMEIYIKFVIEQRPDSHGMVMCFSFHEAEFPLRYAYGAAQK